MPGGIDGPLHDFYFTLSARCTSAARRIDMDPCLHSGLEEVLIFVY